MIAAPLRPTDNTAELAVQPVDGRAEAPGINEIVVRLAIEIGDRSLQTVEFNRHARIIRTFVWHVQRRPVNLYPLLRRSGPPGLPHTLFIVLFPIRSIGMRRDLGLPSHISACLFDLDGVI